jgi:sorbitol-specific phosphotransferase system component IIA
LEELKINTTDIFELTIIQKELRDKHQIYVEVNTDCTTAPKFCYRITLIGNFDLTEKNGIGHLIIQINGSYTENMRMH